MLKLLTIALLCKTTQPLAPHPTTPQSLWRTAQHIAALAPHAKHYGPVVVACTARAFLAQAVHVEAFSADGKGCECTMDELNASLVDRGDGSALLRVAIEEGTERIPRWRAASTRKRPPRARFVGEEAVFAGRGDDLCGLALELAASSDLDVAYRGATCTVGACTLARRGADAVLAGDAAHIITPLPSYQTLPTAGAAWAAAVIDELVRQGVDRFVVAPGARSAPLALACARDPWVRRRMRVVHDERAAAFYALGHARARAGACACVITTSGTAVANLLPAACEADRDAVPVLFATADRPAEMRGVGVDQVLAAQQDLLGVITRRTADLPPADDRVAALGDLGAVSAVAAAAVRADDPGPAHLNLAFRENLAPRRGARRGVGGAHNDPDLATGARWDTNCLKGARYAAWAASDAPWTSTPSAGAVDVASVGKVLRRARRGAVVLGRLAPDDVPDVVAFLEDLNWPVIHADVRSGARASLEESVAVRRPNAVLAALPDLRPDCILQLGASPALAPATRAWLDRAFAGHNAAEKVVVQPGRARVDDDFATSLRFEATPRTFARAAYGEAFPSSRLLRPLLAAGTAADAALDATLGRGFSEPHIARAVTEACHRQDAGLFVSNSMPIRDVDRFGLPVRAEANRGLAGIDGVVATALGYAENHEANTTYLLIGDQALLHDAGSLRCVKEGAGRLRIVLVDNDGGGIFSFLPLATNPAGIEADEVVREEDFDLLFGARHGTDFVQLVQAHGLVAKRASSAADFETLLDDPSVDVIVATPEVQRSENVAIHRALEEPLIEAARNSIQTKLAYERVAGSGPPVVLFHGLFGSREDMRPLGASFKGREVLLVDLAGHGASATEAGFGFEDQVDALLALVHKLYGNELVDVVGYSLGARLALGCKRRRPDAIGRVVAVSARLVGLDGDAGEERRAADAALARRVRALVDADDWATFFDESWYANTAKGGLWGSLRDGPAYAEVKKRRLAHLASNAAASMERAGLGDQPSLQDVVLREDVLLVHGADDVRCAGDMPSALEATVLPGGHALLDEAPAAVADVVRAFLTTAHGEDGDVVITASVVEDFSVATRKPRENAWAGAAAEADAGVVEGAWLALASADRSSVGEAAPCPGVHGESAEAARAALRRCAAKLAHATVPAAVRRLDGSLVQFLRATCGADADVPSVRFALETAVVGLMTRSPSALYASALDRSARGAVKVCALIDAEDDVPAFLPHRVVKLKTGVLSPARDAARVRDAWRKRYRVRVDANRRWSRDQYEAFLVGVGDVQLDFVEEPPFSRDGVPAALDETVAEGDWSPAFEAADVLVAKPSLIGLERTLALARRHRRVVVSSCFESGAGLAHVGLVGAALDDDAQGLGTYAWLATDPFAFSAELDESFWDVGAGEAKLAAFARGVFEGSGH